MKISMLYILPTCEILVYCYKDPVYFLSGFCQMLLS